MEMVEAELKRLALECSGLTAAAPRRPSQRATGPAPASAWTPARPLTRLPPIQSRFVGELLVFAALQLTH